MVHVRIAGGLLRRHVGRGAEGEAERGQGVPARGGFRHRLGHAEVGDQRMLSGEQHVVGLDVAMDHALLVGVGERVGHFAENPRRLP